MPVCLTGDHAQLGEAQDPRLVSHGPGARHLAGVRSQCADTLPIVHVIGLPHLDTPIIPAGGQNSALKNPKQIIFSD